MSNFSINKLIFKCLLLPESVRKYTKSVNYA